MNPIWDTIIIGSGAAGLMTAVWARRSGVSKVLLLDSKEKIGAKILMSGGTRCNITNQRVTEDDYESEEKKIMRAVLQGFSSEKALSFFRELGVDAVLEPGGKYFPSTHSGRTVLEAFKREIDRLGISLEASRKVTGLSFSDGVFKVTGDGFLKQSRTVALCSGGLSYPATGSDGTGYGLAKIFGHSRVKTTPSLTPFCTSDPDWKSLSGITLPVRLSFWEDGKRKVSFEDSFLFTHFGFSGPSVLNLSRHWIRSASKEKKIQANFLPEVKEDDLRRALLDEVRKNPARMVRTFLSGFFPERLSTILLKKSKAAEDLILNQLSRSQREILIRNIFDCPLEVTDAIGYSKAEATAGGIPLSEIDRKTMESKIRSGLFFSGEILDVDGRIGGFNFQWAWASGYLAGRGIAEWLDPGSRDRNR